MSIVFDPSGSLNIATDPSDLPESADVGSISSDALTRCKNLRINQKGVAKTRDGSAKLNETAIEAVNWIEEQEGSRYAFAGESIYLDEESIETDLTDAQWAAVKYNAFNDTTQQVFALNGTDRKRIEGSDVFEWGVTAPTVAPVLSAGSTGGGLTGKFNARYTYLRKVGEVVVYESNPSPSADEYLQLTNQSLLVSIEAPTDTQVTHVRLYRTEANGVIYYRDQDIPYASFAYGATQPFEEEAAYLTGDGYVFTYEDTTHITQNTYTWEAVAETTQINDGSSGGVPWYEEGTDFQDDYFEWLYRQQNP